MSRAVIMAAVRHDRIAVIVARLDQIELVAALRAHLGRPKPAIGSEGEAQIVAMADRKNCAATPPRSAKGPPGTGCPSAVK